MRTIDAATRHTQVGITTAKSTGNFNTTVQLANAYVDAVSILFAPGHAVLTGVRIQYGGNTILPWDGVGGYIVGDNERLSFDVGMYMPGVITIGTHNGDTISHGHFVTFHWHTWAPDAITPAAQIPLVIQ